MIFLKDIEPKHLELLLEYMYKGEIKVQVRDITVVASLALVLAL